MPIGLERLEPYGVTQQGDRLYLARRALKLTQEEMAERCQLERTTYLTMESGKNKLGSLETREALARGFNVSLEDLNAYLAGRWKPEEFLKRTPHSRVVDRLLSDGADPDQAEHVVSELLEHANYSDILDLYAAARSIIAPERTRKRVVSQSKLAERRQTAAQNKRSRRGG